MLGKCGTFVINGNFDLPERKFSTNFSKENAKCCLSLHYNTDNNYLYDDGKGVFKFKVCNKNVNFPTQLCLERKINLTY